MAKYMGKEWLYQEKELRRNANGSITNWSKNSWL